MSLSQYVNNNLLDLSNSINSVDDKKVEVYLCPSYIDDFGVLQDCKCGGRCNKANKTQINIKYNDQPQVIGVRVK